MLTCPKCNSQYFEERFVSKFNDILISPGSGFRPLQDKWKIYVCLNSKCEHVMIPALTSMSSPKSELKIYEEILSTQAGEPKEIPDEPRRIPKPGEILTR